MANQGHRSLGAHFHPCVRIVKSVGFGGATVLLGWGGFVVSFNTTVGGGVLLKDSTNLAAVLRLASIYFCFDRPITPLRNYLNPS